MRCSLLLALFCGVAVASPPSSLLGAGTQSTSGTGCVIAKPDGSLRFSLGQAPGAVAWGAFVDSRDTASNFGKLRISTSAGHPDALQMRAAGYLEGWLTAERVYDQYVNIHSYFANQLYPGVDLTPGMNWLREQEAWVKAQVEAKASEDAQWRAVGLVMQQFEGLVEGYQARAKSALAAQPQHEQQQQQQRQRRLQMQQQRQHGAFAGEPSAAGGSESVGWLHRSDLLFLNNNGDLYDILDHLNGGEEAVRRGRSKGHSGSLRAGDIRSRGLGPGEVFNLLALRGRCSALIKVLGDLSDVYIGHSTWDSFTNALRIFKHYEFNLNDKDVVSRKLSFSSYPGELFSDDDLYITDTRLVVTETTMHIFHPHLLDSLTPASVPSWYRVRGAFMRASSGEEWVRFFSAHNSGTYNNQYMVIDLNRFVPNQEIQSGFLWVVEQIPDSVTAIDATQMVSYAYWPSFNVPYFEQVYNATGYPELIAEMQKEDPIKFEGAIRWLKYQISPRAAIFRRDQGRVRSLDEMKAMMRYNNWRNDPYSGSHPAYSVCGRWDLLEADDENARPAGCYDSKVTSYYLALEMQAEVVNGPPLTADKTPFSWSQGRWADPQFVHRGHPDVFDFQFERMDPRDLPLLLPDGDGGAPAL